MANEIRINYYLDSEHIHIQFNDETVLILNDPKISWNDKKSEATNYVLDYITWLNKPVLVTQRRY